jgi:hypothetical protein
MQFTQNRTSGPIVKLMHGDIRRVHGNREEVPMNAPILLWPGISEEIARRRSLSAADDPIIASLALDIAEMLERAAGVLRQSLTGDEATASGTGERTLAPATDFAQAMRRVEAEFYDVA